MLKKKKKKRRWGPKPRWRVGGFAFIKYKLLHPHYRIKAFFFSQRWDKLKFQVLRLLRKASVNFLLKTQTYSSFLTPLAFNFFLLISKLPFSSPDFQVSLQIHGKFSERSGKTGLPCEEWHSTPILNAQTQMYTIQTPFNCGFSFKKSKLLKQYYLGLLRTSRKWKWEDVPVSEIRRKHGKQRR